MSLAAEVAAEPKGPGGTCPLGILIAGGTPPGSTNPQPLDPDDRDWLGSVTGPGTRQPNSAKLTRTLAGRGYHLGGTAIQRHRRSACSCYSTLRTGT